MGLPEYGKIMLRVGRTERCTGGSAVTRAISIDHFIRENLKQQGLEPSPPADQSTLIRRVTLDPTDFPPSPE
jgi:hypothetical protein